MSRRSRILVVIALAACWGPASSEVGSAQSPSGGSYTLKKFVIAGGGGAPQGMPYSAVVSTGQTAAAVSSGGGFRLVSGFHQARGGSSDSLFCSSFENSPCNTSGANP